MYKCLFKTLSSVLQDVYPEVRLLDHKVILFLTLWGIPTLFCNAPFCIPLNSADAFLFLHILTNTFSIFFYSSHLDGYEVMWRFWFALPWVISDVECLFWCLLVLMISSQQVIFGITFAIIIWSVTRDVGRNCLFVLAHSILVMSLTWGWLEIASMIGQFQNEKESLFQFLHRLWNLKVWGSESWYVGLKWLCRCEKSILSTFQLFTDSWMLRQQICTQRFNDTLKRRLEVNYFEWQFTQFEFTNNSPSLLWLWRWGADTLRPNVSSTPRSGYTCENWLGGTYVGRLEGFLRRWLFSLLVSSILKSQLSELSAVTFLF